MSNTVDERVVKMEFDNSRFEQNVQTSIGTLDRLKQALNFDRASKPLEGIEQAVKKSNIPVLGEAVDAVSSKFSALEIVGITAIANIANSVTNRLKSALDSVTVRPLMDGFKEYETQMDSVQTIMANTGKGVGEVNAALDTMNTYADKTIYNFQEMAANLGRFTAAGTELETSQQAIMGISNLAAVSGSNSQKASVAMYQLSQAIAAGSLKLQDWNSVVNAGMGGKVFQDALQRTAQHMLDANVQVKDASGNMISYKEAIGGTTTSIKDMIAKAGSFRESLKNGWITTDVLTETLRQFQLNVETTEDYENAVKSLVESGYSEEQAKQIADMAKTAMDAATKVKTFSQLIDTTKEALGSGWTKTWQIIFGDFEEAKELWTGVSKVLNGFIDKTSDARNSMLQSWKDLGGRTELIEAISNAFSGLQNVLWPIKEAFDDVFKPLTGETLFAATKRLRELAESIHLSDDAASKLYDAFHGVFSIIDGAKNIFGSLFKIVGPLFEVFKAFFDIFLDIASHIGRAFSGLSESVSASKKFGSAIDAICNILLKFAGFVRNAWAALKDFYHTIKEKVDTPGIHSIWETIKGIGASVLSLKDSAINTIRSIKQSFDGSGILGTLKTIWGTVKQLAGGALAALANVIKQITGAFGSSNASSFTSLINVLTAGGLGIVIKKLLDLKKAFDFSGIKESIGNIGEIFGTLKDTLKSFQQEIQAKTLLTIAAAVGILALSILVLSSIDPDKLNTGLKGITAAFAELIGAMAALNKINADPKKVGVIALGMIFMAAAVLILSAAVKKLSEIDIKGLAKGLISVGLLLKMISQFMNGTYFGDGHVIGNAIGMIFIATAIKILASACLQLGEIPFNTLVKGLISVGVLLKVVSGFLSNTKFGSKAISNAIGMVIMAAAIRLLGVSVEYFGNLDWGVIGKGLAAIGAILLEIAIFSNLTGNAKHVMSTGVSLMFIALAMRVLASAMSAFGGMEWEQIGKGLAAMGGALLEMSIALNIIPKGAIAKSLSLVIVAASLLLVAKVMQQFVDMEWDQIGKGLTAMGLALLEMIVALTLLQGGIGGAFALLILAGALAVITPILIALGNLEFEQIGKGLLALSGALLVLGLAGALLGPFALGLAALGGAIIVVAAGFAVFGLSLLAIATGINALTAALELAPTAISGLITLLDGLVQQIVPKIGDLIEAVLQMLVGLLPTISTTVLAVIENVLTIISGAVPMILESILSILVQVVQMLVEYAPTILQGVIDLFVNLLGVIAKNIPAIINGIISIFIGILQAIAENIPKILNNIVNIIVAVLECIRDAIPRIVSVAAEIIVAFINTVAEKIPDIIDAAFNLIISFIDGLADAIDGNTNRLVSAVSHLISAIINAAIKLFTGVTGTFLKKGGELIKNVAAGIKEHGPEILSKIVEMLKKAIDWIKENGPEWLKAGGELIVNVIKGIGEKIPDIVDKAKELISKAKDGLLEKLDDWIDAGKQMIGGLIEGIGKKADELVEKAKGVVNSAIDAARNLLRINSPSKVFRDMGYSIDEGFIVGMEGMADKVSAASEFVATGIVDAAKKPLDSLADLMSGDMITDPTITPVLDLSEIQNGTDRLYAMLPESEQLSFSGNVRLANDASVSITRDRLQKEASNNEMMNSLINAINGLSALIGTTGNVYNVNGVTYDDGSNVSAAVRSLIHAAKIGGRM